MDQNKKDIFLGVGLAVGFVSVVLFFIPATVVVPPHIKILSLRPDFWPKILSLLITILGLVMAIQGAIKLKFDSKGRSIRNLKEKENPKEKIYKIKLIKTVSAMAGLLIYYFLVELLGIVFASMLAIPGFAFIYGERRFKKLAPLSILLPIILYYFFAKVANIPMPLGIFSRF